ncbi:MAG: hypothetical protein J0L75_09505 [Spirochaetes bacterium]|nr:hypothetical protein [Spirochaetota bacterium]
MKSFFGFGFGPIQSGLMLFEAWKSGNFDRFAVAEVDGEVVSAVRRNRGVVSINIAGEDGVRTERLDRLELWNPADPQDAAALREALASAEELATALPSVDFYERGEPSVAQLLAGLPDDKPRILYAGENHNEAAEILSEKIRRRRGAPLPGFACLNTVIGKMSGGVRGWDEIRRLGLEPLTPELPRAVLVESFNRILITKCPFPSFHRGIAVFEEKGELLPFEEAKLFGHNAVHFTLACLAARRGYRVMSDWRADAPLMAFARELFAEIGGALVHRYPTLCDPLFTRAGFEAYGEDLLVRMTNPFLRDEVGRVSRDPVRKLAPGDRLVGAMLTCLAEGKEPRGFGRATAAGLGQLALHPEGAPREIAALLPADGRLSRDTCQRVMEALWAPHLDPARFTEVCAWVHEGRAWLAENGLG